MNAALTRAYERLGRRYIPAVIGLAWALSLGQAAIAIWLELRYLDATSHQFWQLTAYVVPVVLAALAVGLLLSWNTLAPPLRWLREGRPPELVPEVWRRSVGAGFAVVNRSALAIAIVIVPYHLVASPAVLDVGLGVVPALILFGELALVTGWLVLQFLVDLALKPVMRDLASQLPADLDDPPSGWQLRSKAIMTVPVAACYGAFAAGAFVFGQTGPEARLYAAIAAAVVVTLTFAGPVAAIATSSILDPVQDLIAATQRVARGELSMPVPILTDDEFGGLGRSFNLMQIGLLEREELRDQNVQLVEALRAASARIVAATDAERRRLERDLHDGAQQNLVLLNLKLGILARTADKNPSAVPGLTEELQADLTRAIAELRDLAHGIYPQLLEQEGLPAALEDAVQRSATPATVESNSAGRYAPELEAAVYFCCLEALQNASKHAGDGAKATVSLSQENGELRFEVQDDGKGYDVFSVGPSAGLQNMADRIGALGGDLQIDSAPGEGTRVSGVVPLIGPAPGVQKEAAR